MATQNDKTSGPRFHVFISKKLGDSCRRRQPAGFWQAHEKQAPVSAGRKFSNIREIEVLCDKKPVLLLGLAPNIRTGQLGKACLKWLKEWA